MNKYYLISAIVAILYVFGIGGFLGAFAGYALSEEGSKINDFKSPADFIGVLLATPLLAIFWSAILFFRGMEGLEDKE